MDANLLNRVLIEGIQDILLVIGVRENGELFYELINQMAVDRIGLTKETVGKTLEEVHSADRAAFFKSNHNKVIQSKQEYVYEDEYLSPSGKLFYSETRLTPLLDDNGKVRHIVVLVHDVTDKKVAESDLEKSQKKLLESQDQFRIITENSTDLIVLINADGNVDYISPSTEQLLGYKDSVFFGRQYADFIHPDDVLFIDAKGAFPDGTNRYLKKEYRMRNSAGRWVWFELHGSAVYDEQGKFSHFVAVSRDISSRMEYEKNLKHFAYHDVLTNLPNRRYFYKKLTETLAARQGRNALLLLDIDQFKAINDRHGHDRGDQVIQEFAKRLQDAVPEKGAVSRLGGDEFAIILPEIVEEKDGTELAKHILQAVRKPWFFGGETFKLTTSIGLAFLSGEENATIEEFIKQADLALYAAKEAGRDCYRIYR